MRLLCLLLLPIVMASASDARVIRIGLLRKDPPAEVQAVGPLTVYRGMTKKAVSTGRVITLNLSGGRAILKPATPGGAITLLVGAQPRSYRGEITVTPLRQRLLLVNRLDTEDYIRSVLPAEMPSDWPIQALAAQAVVARSFAIASIGRHAGEGFDLCDLTHCQVYRGASWERPQTNTAVDMSRGQIVTFQGRCVPVPYHSTCGGQTTDSTRDEHRGPEYLTGIQDGSSKPWCSASPHYRWSCSLSAEDLERALESDGHTIPGTPKSLTIRSSDASGRALTIVIQAAGTVAISGEDLMIAIGRHLGWNKIKSTRFTVQERDGEFFFSGSGLGHGMGLCQWGARGMALNGRSYADILRHYLPKCRVERS